ncbi:MAG: hypothetical protein CVU72_01555 [Deltaproteobacteria bacterium HGW-Deltaproteobacteria-7]|nr:MAG: hypothetical protein CVU72_01555 [Deltaproteobacteria bacterium HGW-Deltaproteobacteria-7]PKN20694.1 MAG: hypothetical protein CVU71_02610 [Deltaproteobacteria bacterium HGW-Deltaproteobacteria-6]
MMKDYCLYRWMRACLGISVFLLAWTSGSVASAQSVDRRTTATTTAFSERFSAEIYGGYLKGQSREVVYNASNGAKLSELFWSIDNAYLVGLNLAVRPIERLKLSIGGWMPVTSGNTMDDYDWLATNGFDDWTHWSHSPDTKLNRAYMIDTRAAFTMTSFKNQPDTAKPWQIRNASLDMIVGYRWVNLDWTAYGGSYIYTSEDAAHNVPAAGGSIRDTVGQFESGKSVISYTQWWGTPYAGIGGSIGINRWTLSAEVIGSLWAKGRDRDDHHLRTLIFEESFSNVHMVGVNMGIDCNLTEHLSIFTRFDYQKFFEGKGSSTNTNYETGVSETNEGDAAGADFYSMIFSLGLKLSF